MRALMKIPFILLDSLFATLTETQDPLSIKQELQMADFMWETHFAPSSLQALTCSVAQRAANLYLWDRLHTRRDLQ